MKKIKQLGIASLSALLLSSFTLPAFASAQVANGTLPVNTGTQIELPTGPINKDARTELELRQVDYNALFRTVGSELGMTTAAGEVGTLGWKTKLAKEVAQELIKKLKNVGSRAWNEQIKVYVDKLPLTAGAKTTLKTYLSYQVLMQALDIMVDFSGTAEDGLSNALQSIGVPGWLSDPAARAIVFFLL
ncbi:hypothetical protein BK131_03375 [Paenibacillus amylolyticus]|uniref:Uncharacterized protein n=1 Tax=Paenibacillus amylolyticus TaxID=1451 RepID=A0A100VM43_PAEAM|nr:hypothetical protein [Paenibacillus amylolyticus]OMF17029.1 hypothetical protein BK131_03375 [Paenibacillus amylolyticus]GAS82411.1 unknown protein [Paenibacillus amylolyticus]